MTRRIQILAGGVILLFASYGLARVGVDKGYARRESSPPVPPTDGAFAIAKVHLEQNATDGDCEFVLEAMGGDEGLVKLTVVAPDGRTIVDFTTPGASKLGIREFRFESPEPTDIKILKSAYPEGVYTFSGTTANGAQLHGKATLSYRLPPPPSLLSPKAGVKGVGVKDLKITWTPAKNVSAYSIYIEQEALDINLTTTLPGSMDTFAVPDGFLLPSAKYVLGLGTVTTSGNISFIETSFTTAGQKDGQRP